jgi:hypothetical protein
LPTAVDYMAMVERADRLPDASVSHGRFAAGVSVWTLHRNNPVPPVQITARMRGRKLGEIRQLTATKQSARTGRTDPFPNPSQFQSPGEE